MGESLVEKPSVEKEMSDLDRAVTPLEVSVSFGRFENDDSLSWEKWSSFSPNKYLEEVGKYSTPGSVAQKKAYFEAHYKKIAAQKAEQLEQDKPLASPPTPTRDESEKKTHVKLTYVADEELELSSNGRSGEDLESEETVIESAPIESEKQDNTSQIKQTSVSDCEYDVFSDGRSGENLDQDTSRNRTVNPASSDGGKKDVAAIGEDRKDRSVEEVEEKLNSAPDNIESNDKDKATEKLIQIEEAVNIQAETSQKILPESVVEQSSKDVVTTKTLVEKKKSIQVPARSTARKMTPPKKELYPPEAKKKVAAASPVRKSLTTIKLSQVSTSGLSKSTIMPASQPSTKKVSKPTFPKSNYTSPGEHRRAVPTSLHMSMSLDTAKPLSSVMPIRKSLIMEQMADKDIVRRAFKTFQKQVNGVASSNNGVSNGQQQMSATDSEQKATRALTPQKENERLRKSAEKTNPRGDVGNRSNQSSSVLHKGPGAERKKPTAESPSTKLRSDARYEKQKQVEKDAQLKKAKQGLDLKATLTPPHNRGDIKIPSRKEDSVKSHHRPTSDSKGR